MVPFVWVIRFCSRFFFSCYILDAIVFFLFFHCFIVNVLFASLTNSSSMVFFCDAVFFRVYFVLCTGLIYFLLRFRCLIVFFIKSVVTTLFYLFIYSFILCLLFLWLQCVFITLLMCFAYLVLKTELNHVFYFIFFIHCLKCFILNEIVFPSILQSYLLFSLSLFFFAFFFFFCVYLVPCGYRKRSCFVVNFILLIPFSSSNLVLCTGQNRVFFNWMFQCLFTVLYFGLCTGRDQSFFY